MKNCGTIIRISLSWMVLLAVVVGCSRKATTATTLEVTDSTHVRMVPRFITITQPGDTVTIVREIECDKTTNKAKAFSIEKKLRRATSIARVDNDGRLHVTTVCDSLSKTIEAQDKEIYRLRRHTKTETIYKTEYKKSSFDQFTNWYFAITIVGIVIYVFRWLYLNRF